MIHVKAGSYKQLGKLIANLGRKEARAATSRAIKRAATTVTKEAVNQIRRRKLVKLSAGDLKAMFSTRVSVRGNIAEMNAVVSLSNQAISLAKYYARQVTPPKGMQRRNQLKSLRGFDSKLKAVKVTVMGRTQYAGAGKAFLVKNKGGGVIFMRTGKARTPIRKLFGPSVSDLVIYTGLQDTLQEIASERFQTVLAQEIAFRTAKLALKKG